MIFLNYLEVLYTLYIYIYMYGVRNIWDIQDAAGPRVATPYAFVGGYQLFGRKTVEIDLYREHKRERVSPKCHNQENQTINPYL
jgi:hypothetical protein